MRVLLILLMLSPAAIGCARMQGPETLVIAPGDYARAFTVALDVVRDEQLAPTLRDPRTGVIEAGPATVGSMLEPWKSSHNTFDSALESTIHHQRRQVRIEFTTGNPQEDAALDLTAAAQPLELRVEAWLERAYQPGRGRALWSRQLSQDVVMYAPGETETPVERRFWLPVRRDAEYESHLMALLQRALEMQDGPPASAPPAAATGISRENHADIEPGRS